MHNNTNPEPNLRLYGRPGSAAAYSLRDFLQRSDVPFEYTEIQSIEQARRELNLDTLDDHLPLCIFPDGTRMEKPTIRRITEKLGWFRDPLRAEYDLAIYGGGPAGLSAAVYGASEGLKTVLIERFAVGGQAGSSSKIENYLGFPRGISGADLAERAREQACKFGAEILIAREALRGEFQIDKRVGILTDGTRIVARAAICSTGIAYRRLNLPREDEFLGAGIYYGAGSSEASLCGDEHVLVIGGGNSAGQAAMHFSRYARKVSIVIRGGCLKETLSTYLLDRVEAAPNIEVLRKTSIVALEGTDVLDTVTLRNLDTGGERTVETRWVFVCIGGEPHTEWALDAGVARDEAGYLVTGPDLVHYCDLSKTWPLDRDPYFLECNLPGMFAAGDVRHGSVKRCASAVGEGAMAVTFAHQYLSHA